ncbi:MAG: DUF983 domain-containing protein [Acidobacteriota bacterium]
MSEARRRPPRLRTLVRGWRRRCPHCGRAPIFAKWFTLNERCEVCGLRFEKSPGDTWALWIIGDRVFVGLVIILVFIIFRSSSWTLGGAILLVAAVPLVWTMPHRMGVCLAFDYLIRAYWGEASDVPPPVE